MAKPMAQDNALALPELTVSESDYNALLSALLASGVGRAFLSEYARRNRHAETETVLAALARLESLLTAREPAEQDTAPETVSAFAVPARLTIVPKQSADEFAPAPSETAVQTPSEAAVAERRPTVAPAPPSAAPPVAAREYLSVDGPTAAVIPFVSWSVEIEPRPGAQAAAPAASALSLTAVAVTDLTLAQPVPSGESLAATRLEAPPPALSWEVATSPEAQADAATLPPVDPLADLMALTEDERLALFS